MRRGKFGRNRGGSPNLTALIAGLMREQRAAEDRAISDAYQNGGLYKGKPVTDARYLGYLTTRRDGFSKDDPLYDQWNNSVIQTTFSIGEQKIDLAFKQGHASAGAVAAWYRGQLSKIPKDSAFYRTVAGRAADWAKSAAGAARGRARGGVTKALNAKLAKLGETTANYDALTNGLEDIARRAGFIAGNQTLTDATAAHLEQLFGMGITFLGKPVTLDSWKKAATARYGVFDATIAAYQQAGRKVPKSLLTAKGKFLDQTLVRMNAVDDRAKYEAARAHFNDVVSAAQNDPNAVLAATKDYISTLSQIRDAALAVGGTNTNDPEFIGGLANEINSLVTGKASGPTVTDIQSNTGEGVVTNDAEKLAAGSAKYQQEYQDLHSGQSYYGQGTTGMDLGVHPYPPGGEFDQTGHHGLGEGFQAILTNADGVTQSVVLRGTPVYGGAIFNANGVIVPANTSPDEIAAKLASGEWHRQDGDKPLGYIYTNPVDQSEHYAVRPPDGRIVYTDSNPFTSLTTDGKGNLIVDTSQARVGANNKLIFLPGAGLVPGFNPAGSAPVLVDSSVSPDDIGKFYDPTNPAIADYLDRRAKAAATAAAGERAAAESFINTSTRGLSTLPPVDDGSLSHALDQGAIGPLGQMLNEGLGALGNVVRTLTAPSVSPPSLGASSAANVGAPPPVTSHVPGAPGSDTYGPPAPSYSSTIPGAAGSPYYGPPVPTPSSTVPGATGSPVYGPPAPPVGSGSYAKKKAGTAKTPVAPAPPTPSYNPSRGL